MDFYVTHIHHTVDTIDTHAHYKQDKTSYIVRAIIRDLFLVREP